MGAWNEYTSAAASTYGMLDSIFGIAQEDKREIQKKWQNTAQN